MGLRFVLDKRHEYEDSIHVEAITRDSEIAFSFYMTKLQFDSLVEQANEWFGNTSDFIPVYMTPDGRLWWVDEAKSDATRATCRHVVDGMLSPNEEVWPRSLLAREVR